MAGKTEWHGKGQNLFFKRKRKVAVPKAEAQLGIVGESLGLKRRNSNGLAIPGLRNKTGFLGQKITVGTRGIFGFSTTVGFCGTFDFGLYKAKIEIIRAFKEQILNNCPELINPWKESPSQPSLSSRQSKTFRADASSAQQGLASALSFCIRGDEFEKRVGLFLAWAEQHRLS